MTSAISSSSSRIVPFRCRKVGYGAAVHFLLAIAAAAVVVATVRANAATAIAVAVAVANIATITASTCADMTTVATVSAIAVGIVYG